MEGLNYKIRENYLLEVIPGIKVTLKATIDILLSDFTFLQ